MRLLAFVALAAVVCGCVQQETGVQTQVIAPSGPRFRADLVACSFDKFPSEGKGRFNLFFKVLSVGETPTRVPAQVCLAPSGSMRPHCINLNQAYAQSEVLWGEINWTDGKRGQEWHIEGASDARQDVEYTLFYTEDQYDLSKGAVTLYSGSTESCQTVEH